MAHTRLLRLLLIAALAAGAAPLHAQLLPETGAAGCRSVSNSLLGEDAPDLEAWKRDLDATRDAGFNTVWMLNAWRAFQPSADPVEWDEAKIARLQEICRETQQRQMALLLLVWGKGEVRAGWMCPSGRGRQSLAAGNWSTWSAWKR